MGPDCIAGPDVSPDILTHGFFPPLVLVLVLGVVRDVTGSYSIAFMLLSEFALSALIINLLALQGHAEWFRPVPQLESPSHAGSASLFVAPPAL